MRSYVLIGVGSLRGLAGVARDGRTYDSTLRPGLRFSDGRPLTAAHCAVALRRVLNPVMHSYGAVLFSDVERVDATGLRLRVRLTRPARTPGRCRSGWGPVLCFAICP